jgi:hypothetical protein
LLEALHFDPQTGVFVWRVSTGQRVKAGEEAGCIDNGYRVIKLDGRMYRAHRLAWFYCHGEWPAQQIDHRNGRRDDNRLSNLRVVDNSTNMENQREARADSCSGLMGVRLHHRGHCWEARIKVKGRSRRLGSFASAELAHAAYLAAKRVAHAGCTI